MPGCLGTATCLRIGAQPPDILVLSARPRCTCFDGYTVFQKEVYVCV